MERDPGDPRPPRARSALAVGGAGLGILFLVFVQMQVLNSPLHEVASGSTLRPERIPAARGVILDRHGSILAETVPAYAVYLTADSRASALATLDRLVPHLDLDDDEIDRLAAGDWAGGRKLLVSADVPLEVAALLLERRAELQDVQIETWPKRHYPAGRSAAHVVGVVGPPGVGDEQDGPGRKPLPRMVGRLGVERRYDERLQGRDGMRYLEVDAEGVATRSLDLPAAVPAVPGQELRLNLDLAIQRAVAEAIPEDERVAVVAFEAATGEVRVLYSSPSYDPVRLPAPVVQDGWPSVTEDWYGSSNRAVEARYPPGPAMKVVTAALALGLGLHDGETVMPVPCRGGMSYGDRYLRCSDSQGHGLLDLGAATSQNCHVYFYQLGLKIGPDNILAAAGRLGLGRGTGVDLPDEALAVLPAATSTGNAGSAGSLSGTDAMRMAAGVGLVEVSPLEMAHLFAMLVTDRPVPRPRLATHAPIELDDRVNLVISPADRAWLRAALTREEQPSWQWSGVSGSTARADVPVVEWWLGLASPGDGAPELVVAVVVEGGTGTTRSAELAGLVVELYREGFADTRRAARSPFRSPVQPGT